MEKNNLIKGMMGILVCVILLGGLLLPIVSSALVVTGDPVSLDQRGSIATIELGEISTADEIIIEVLDGSVNINGAPLALGSPSTWTPIVYTDAGIVQVRNETYSVQIMPYVLGSSTATSVPAGNTITVKNGVVSVSDETISGFNFTIGYSVGLENNLAMLIDMGARYTGRSIINDINDIIILGNYTTGENDTIYSFINGNLSITEDFESSYTTDLSLVSGTTDIYSIESFNLIVGGESFTPYHALAPIEINGHKDSGAAYSMVAVLPIITIVSIVLAGIYVFIGRKY